MNVESVEVLLVEDSPDDVELTCEPARAQPREPRQGSERRSRGARLHPPDDPPTLRATGYRSSCCWISSSRGSADSKLLRRLKASEATKTIPIVVLTSSQEESDRQSYRLVPTATSSSRSTSSSSRRPWSGSALYWLLLNKVPE